MEGGGGRGGGQQWVGGHCFVSFMLLAGVSQASFRIASLPLLDILGGGTLLCLLLSVVGVPVPLGVTALPL